MAKEGTTQGAILELVRIVWPQIWLARASEYPKGGVVWCCTKEAVERSIIL
jgi:hypothetical protein